VYPTNTLFTPNALGAQPMRLERYRGVNHSIKAMTEAVLSPRGGWSPTVRLAAESICKHVAPKDYLSEILAVRYWVLEKVPYINDPVHVEWIRDPQAMLEKIAKEGKIRADCDEITALTTALLLNVGRRCQFITAGFAPPPAPHSHVFGRVEIPGMKDKWVVYDPVAGSRENTMLMKIKSYTTYEVDRP